MEKLLLMVVSCCLCLSGYAQNKYYYADGQKIDLQESTQSFIIHGNAEAMMGLRQYSSTNKSSDDGINNVQAFDFKMYGIVDLADGQNLKLSTLSQNLGIEEDDIIAITPGLQLSDGFTVYLTTRIVCQPKHGVSPDQIKSYLADYDIRVIEAGLNKVLRIEAYDFDKMLDMANDLHTSGLVNFAQPDFYAPIKMFNDPLYPEQFQMNNTGQTVDGYAGQVDADCNAAEAWATSTGSSSITVAVIDDGLEAHEDFNDSNGNSRITGGFTPVNNGNGAPNSSGAHGVSCGGIISASHNSIGVRGVAPNVKMTTVNIFQGGESNQDIADGITWAKNNGADVMSNSWGFNSCTFNSSTINAAISDAVNNGRNGKGCVVAFSSGNTGNSCVNYPAYNPDVIAVGAFHNQGSRSSYSAYGPSLDIIAPSNGRAGVRTTDRMGSAGYGSGNYTPSFGGTSAACPVVAGVAALVLSVDPNLTDAQVKNTLYTTAKDMGPAGFDNEYGNGGVDAEAALNSLGGGGGPTCSDGIQNGDETGIDCGGSSCADCPTVCTENELTLSIILDNYPEETSWELTEDGSGSVVASGGTYGSQPDGSTVTEDMCLSDGCYTFTIFDVYGDGICCSYGSGSYDLSDGSTTYASGAQFAFDESTSFCLGGGGADTEAPTAPLNLTASNTTTNSTDLSWNASSDNVGVTGYNVYVDGVLNGTTTSTNYSVTGLAENTSYTMAVSAFDAAGNESAQSSVQVTTQTSGGGGSDQVFASYFETGWDGWSDGGSDCYRYSGSRSWEGSYSIRIRDNSGTASAMTSSTYDLSNYNSVDLTFYFYPNSMENGEDFWVRYNDGSGWQTVATYARGTSFENNQFYTSTVTLNSSDYNLSSTGQFRFQCDASGNADRVYIDEVTLTGNSGTASATSTGQTIALSRISSNDFNPRLEDVDIAIAPNPATDFINVFVEDDYSKIQIHDIKGSLVRTINTIQNTVDVTVLAPGVYLLSVHTQDEMITKKFVKQ